MPKATTTRAIRTNRTAISTLTAAVVNSAGPAAMLADIPTDDDFADYIAMLDYRAKHAVNG
jgi:hypothetical protein